MKTWKRLAALAMSAVMAVGMMLPAGAAQMPGGTMRPCTITVMNVESNASYTAYRLFDLNTKRSDEEYETDDEYYEAVGHQYTLSAYSPWYKFFSEGKGKDYVDLVEPEGGLGNKKEYRVQPTDKFQTEADAAALAKDAMAALKDGTVKFASDEETNLTELELAMFQKYAGINLPTKKEIDSTVTLDRPSTTGYIAQAPVLAGYYLVDSSMGSLCALGTSDVNAIVEEKNVQPTVLKQVWEDRYGSVEGNYFNDAKGWGSTNDAEIGETVWYRATINNIAGTENLTLFDMMYPGLTFDNSSTLEVYLNDEELRPANPENKYAPWDYAVEINENWYKGGSKVPVAGGDAGDSSEGGIKDTDMAEELANYDDQIDSHMREEGTIGASQQSATFAVKFNDNLFKDLTENDQLVVIYSAVLNENARISPNGNDNIAMLGYGTGKLVFGSASMLAQANQTNQEVLGLSDDIPVGGDENEGIETHMQVQHNITAFKATFGLFSKASTTTTYTYQLDMVKVDGRNNVLDDATFKLIGENGEAVKLVPYEAPDVSWPSWNTGTIGVLQGTLQLLQTGNEGGDIDTGETAYAMKLYRPAKPGEAGAIEEFEAGITAIVGLDHGNYQLEEVKAPDGYNKINAPIQLEVVSQEKTVMKSGRELSGVALLKVGDSDALISMTFGGGSLTGDKETGLTFTPDEGGLAVVNLTGNELPSTGGMGTTIFYAVGGLLVVGAGILLIVKKRMGAEE